MTTRTKWTLALGVLGIAAGSFGLLHWHTSGAIREAQTQIAAGASVPFQVFASGAAGSNLFELYAAAPDFVDAVGWDGRVILAGAGQLGSIGLDGSADVYRAGESLPPARLTALAEGLALQGPGRVLYAATAGEGLLIVTRFAPLEYIQVRAEEMRHRDLTAVLPLGDGRIALGTRRAGVLVYDGERLAQLHEDLAATAVTALAGDASELWVGTIASGAYHLRGGAIEKIGVEQGLADPHVSAIRRHGDKTYVATPMGVSAWADGRLERVVAEGLFVRTMHARENELLLGTLDQGAYSVPLDAQRRPGRSLVQPLPAIAQAAEIRAFVEASDGVVALAPDGLQTVAGAVTAPRIEAGGALTHRNISSLAFDSAGRLWAGYFDRGLDILSPGGRRELHIEDDVVFCVNRIAVDERGGRMYVGTANGLAVYDGNANRISVMRKEDGLLADHVTDVLPRRQGLTVATPAGLSFVDSRGARGLYAFHGLVNNHVYALGESGGELLAGTLGGLSLLSAETVRTSLTTANSGLRHNWITAAIASGGEWFLGTYGAGVARLTAGGEVVSFPEIHGQLEINPLAVAASNDHVFAGSLGRGLWIYSRAADRWTQVTAGLPSTNVTAVAVHDGWLWAATDNGLVRAEIARLPS